MSRVPRHGSTPESGWRIRSANDRLKDGWNARVAWSIVAAVGLHVLVFGFWPTWDRASEEPEEDPLELTPIELITLYEQPAGLGRAGMAAVPVSEIPDSTPTPADVREGAEREGEELAGLAAALRDRLRRGSGLRPTVVEREPATEEAPEEEEEPSSEGEERGDIPGRATSTAELTELPEPSSLALDRLSALRPELALVSPSNWVLIRNPTDVERFMERTYRRGDIDRGESGLVSVALWIDERGSVEWAEINRSSGRTSLDEVALQLFSEVVAFRPARDEGVPVSRSVIFSVRFPWY